MEALPPTPGELTAGDKDIEPAALAGSGHHRGAKQLAITQHLAIAKQAPDKLIQVGDTGGIAAPGPQLPIGQGRQLAQPICPPIGGEGLQVVAPETAVLVEDHQQGTLARHEPTRDQRHQLKKTAQVREAAQGIGQRCQQVLMAPLFLAQAVEPLAHRWRG